MGLQRSKFLFVYLFVASIFIGCKNDDDDEVIFVEDPNFVTSDIDLFWEVFDNASNFSTTEFQTNYVDQGTVGLQDYAAQKDLANGLQSVLNNSDYLGYYEAVRANTLDIGNTETIASQGFDLLKSIYPETKFLNVYFIIGSLSAGGRISENGLLVAAEMFSAPVDYSLENLNEWHQNVIRTNTYLPSIVVHELIHVQQFSHANSSSVLEACLAEGMADFISHHILADQPFMNEHLHEYGNPKEEEIWAEFREEMNQNINTTEWLYTGQTTQTGHPADMGYYVGYKILESYSQKFSTTNEAIVQMLSTKSYLTLYEESGYAEKFD